MCTRSKTCHHYNKTCDQLNGRNPCYREAKYRCVLCGRDKFNRPTPHNCAMGFLKHFNRHARKLGLATIWEKT